MTFEFTAAAAVEAVSPESKELRLADYNNCTIMILGTQPQGILDLFGSSG